SEARARDRRADHLSPEGRLDGGVEARLSRLAVILGWSEGPDHRCAIAHRGISRFRVRCFASPRNDGASESRRLRRTELPGFPTQHRLLAGDAPVIAGELAVLAERAMAGHHERHWV